MATGASVFSFEPAADRLIARGLRADKTELIRRLEMVGEFRLTDYAQFFRAENLYRGDATLEALWGIVEFDNRLRSLCFEAIGCIEVQVRSNLAYRFADEYGPYEYLDATNFPNFSRQGPTFTWWLGKIKEAQENLARDHTGSAPASNVTIPGSEPELPIWTIAENIDFGTTLSFFQGVADNIQKDVASALGQPDAIANSW